MNSSDSELLRRFVDDGVEDAFTELVRRHLDLVFSAALRQVGPDTQAAEDVALKVFADLARKSSDLVAHPTLTGWLFGSTRLAAMEYRRFESRRIVRETRAHAMSQLLSDATAAEPDWNRVRPVLDEAILELNDDDREAVLLRYFEKRPLAEIGSRLGLSENTARMRVDRALDKLHAALARRGITSATGALAAALGANAVSAAPAGMVERIGRKASGSRPVTGGRVFAGKGLGIPGGWMAVVTAVFLAGIGVLMWTNRRDQNAKPTTATVNLTTAASPVDGIGSGANHVPAPEDLDNAATGSNTKSPEQFVLKIVAEDSEKPVPGVSIRHIYTYLDQNSTAHWERAETTSDGSGEARITLPARSDSILVQTYLNGFASMKLDLHTRDSDSLPAGYTIKLPLAPEIGGLVVNPDGSPVTNVIVSISVIASQTHITGTEFPDDMPTSAVTGSDGRWKAKVIAGSLLPRLHLLASHPDFDRSEATALESRPELLNQLHEQKLVLRLRDAGAFRGIVLDESGRPLSGAKVFTGLLDSGLGRETETASDGTFEIRGAELGLSPITAHAEGYAAKTAVVNITKAMGPLRMVLNRGSLLRLRVLGHRNCILSNAEVSFITRPMSRSGMVPTQTRFSGKTDVEGRLEWDQAPAGVGLLQIKARNYLEEHAEVMADGMEHIVRLKQSYIHGTITDAATGRPIPSVQFRAGWPEVNPYQDRTNAMFHPVTSEYQSSRGTIDGGYSMLFHEKVWPHAAFPGYVIKFESKGYQTYISRPIRYDEGDVVLDVALEKAVDFEASLIDRYGRPVPGAEVAIIEPGAEFKLRQGHLLDLRTGRLSEIRHTDSEGKIKMTKNPLATHLVAVHDDGYIAAGLADAGNKPVFQMQPWSRIEGTLSGTTGSATGRVMTLAQRDLPETALFIADETPVDPDGRFVFQKVPPGRLLVRQMSRMRSSISSFFNTVGRSVETTVAPGETETVTIGGAYSVAGRFLLPAGTTVPEGGFIGAALYIPGPVPAAEITDDPQAMRSWRLSPEVQAQELQAVTLGIDLRTDGSFVVDTVSPGNYRLKLSIYPPRSTFAGSPHRTPITFTREVVIPEQPGEGRIDLGEIQFAAPDR